jgi:hypothetical protein
MQIGWATDMPGIYASAPERRKDEIVGAVAIRIQGGAITEVLRNTLRWFPEVTGSCQPICAGRSIAIVLYSEL